MGENPPTVGTEGHGGQFVVSIGLGERGTGESLVSGLHEQGTESRLVSGRQEREGVGGTIPMEVDLRVVGYELTQGMGRLYRLIAGRKIRSGHEEELGHRSHHSIQSLIRSQRVSGFTIPPPVRT